MKRILNNMGPTRRAVSDQSDNQNISGFARLKFAAFFSVWASENYMNDSFLQSERRESRCFLGVNESAVSRFPGGGKDRGGGVGQGLSSAFYGVEPFL